MALKQKIQQLKGPKVVMEEDTSPLNIPRDIGFLTNAISQYFAKPNIISPLALGSGKQEVLAAQTTPTPQKSQKPTLTQLIQNIKNGFTKYGMDPDQASQVAPYFAQAGQDLPDPYLPATQALKESSGGKTNQGKNNWFNVMNPDHTPVDYPDMKTSLLGGNGHQGFSGIMHNGLYNKYLQSGKLEDFFTTYSPPTDNNPDLPTQVQQYNSLRSNFTGS